jgi:hypothetical protein
VVRSSTVPLPIFLYLAIFTTTFNGHDHKSGILPRMSNPEIPVPQQPESKERPTPEINLRQDQEGAIRAIAELEEYSPEYLAQQLRERPVPSDLTGSIGEAIAWLKQDEIQNWKWHNEKSKKRHEEGNLEMPVFTIYGNGGLQRYYVNVDGYVWFSLHHTRADRKDRGRDASIDDNPYWRMVKQKGFRLLD